MSNTYLTYLLADTTTAIGLAIAVLGLLLAATSYSRATKAWLAVLDNPADQALRLRLVRSSKWASRGLWIVFAGIGIQALAAFFVLIVY